MIHDVNQRAELLSDFCKGLNVSESYPLIREVRLAQNDVYRSVLAYIRASINGSTDISDVLSAPNLTPNGILRPKRETYLEYNLIHKSLGKMVRELGIDKNILKMRLPVSVRVVNGVREDRIENRPRANSKLHSDFWTGGCCDLALIMPIMGDIENTTIRFGEPIGMKEGFLSELPSYDDGMALYESMKPYPLTMRAGHLYFQDIYCLHGTSRNGGGIRVSLDWTVQTKNYPLIEKLYSSKSLAVDNHFPMSTWYRMGESLLYFDSQGIEECRRQHNEPEVKLGAAVGNQTARTAKFVNLVAAAPALQLARC